MAKIVETRNNTRILECWNTDRSILYAIAGKIRELENLKLISELDPTIDRGGWIIVELDKKSQEIEYVYRDELRLRIALNRKYGSKNDAQNANKIK